MSESESQSSGVPGITRRSFLKRSSSVALALPFASSLLSADPKDKPSVAFIGTDGRANAHLNVLSQLGVHCPCYCDVDKKRQAPAAKKWPDADAYQDYRRMFDEKHNEIDAVVVCTPDHHHFPASAIALQLGIHVYCEKPLTWSVGEARKLTRMAAERDLATQMGNQLHDTRFWDHIIGWIRQGAIGEVQEVHTWSNKHNWVDGIKSPQPSTPPDHLDWNLWLGPAKKQPYAAAYHPKKWRGAHPFGTGSVGDMAGHLLDGMYMALEPGHPESVELVESHGSTPNTYPEEAIVKWEYDPDDYPSFTSFWYDGSPDNKPEKPEAISKERWNRTGQGNLFIGTEGMIFGGYTLGQADNGALVFKKDPVLLPEDRAKEVGKPDPNFMPDPTAGRHHAEFLTAVTGEQPIDFPSSNFQYAGPLTEVVLLGSLAQRRGAVGKPLSFDAENLKITNDQKANALLTRNPREGWDVV